MHGKGETERAALSGSGPHTDPSSVLPDDPFADGEPHAGAGFVRIVVQPFEGGEDDAVAMTRVVLLLYYSAPPYS